MPQFDRKLEERLVAVLRWRTTPLLNRGFSALLPIETSRSRRRHPLAPTRLQSSV